MSYENNGRSEMKTTNPEGNDAEDKIISKNFNNLLKKSVKVTDLSH